MNWTDWDNQGRVFAAVVKPVGSITAGNEYYDLLGCDTTYFLVRCYLLNCTTPH
jgi:hypothetical protein